MKIFCQKYLICYWRRKVYISGVSLLSYISDELNRDYMLEHNEQKLKERRRRVYTFVKTPRELEKVFNSFIVAWCCKFYNPECSLHVKA